MSDNQQHPLADEDQLVLPPDLAALAEQLGADAQFLASRYPARVPSSSRDDEQLVEPAKRRVNQARVARTAAGTSRKTIWTAAVVAAILLIAPAAYLLMYARVSSVPRDRTVATDIDHHSTTSSPQDAGRHHMFDQQQSSNGSDDRILAGNRRDHSDTGYAGSRQPLPVEEGPEYLLQQATGPEREALLDLLEEESPQQISLSL